MVGLQYGRRDWGRNWWLGKCQRGHGYAYSGDCHKASNLSKSVAGEGFVFCVLHNALGGFGALGGLGKLQLVLHVVTLRKFQAAHK